MYPSEPKDDFRNAPDTPFTSEVRNAPDIPSTSEEKRPLDCEGKSLLASFPWQTNSPPASSPTWPKFTSCSPWYFPHPPRHCTSSLWSFHWTSTSYDILVAPPFLWLPWSPSLLRACLRLWGISIPWVSSWIRWSPLEPTTPPASPSPSELDYFTDSESAQLFSNLMLAGEQAKIGPATHWHFGQRGQRIPQAVGSWGKSYLIFSFILNYQFLSVYFCSFSTTLFTIILR